MPSPVRRVACEKLDHRQEVAPVDVRGDGHVDERAVRRGIVVRAADQRNECWRSICESDVDAALPVGVDRVRKNGCGAREIGDGDSEVMIEGDVVPGDECAPVDVDAAGAIAARLP